MALEVVGTAEPVDGELAGMVVVVHLGLWVAADGARGAFDEAASEGRV